MERWLNGRGLATFSMLFDATLDETLQTMGALNPRLLYLLGGKSRTGCGHAVLCRGGEIIHDPSLYGSGITGTCDDGYSCMTMRSEARRGGKECVSPCRFRRYRDQ